MTEFWKPGDVITWRGIYRNRIWHVQTTIVVKDSPEETVLTLVPGAECMAEESYLRGKESSKRWWDFKDSEWRLTKYTWHTNRFLLIFEPEKYYSTILFWKHATDEFLYYYINFQLPFKRSLFAIDTLDLELDIIIPPNLSYQWKDVDDYQNSLEQGGILPDWAQGIEDAKPEILDKLHKRRYPFDGSWLDWMPNPSWSPPKLPENWDKI